MNVRWGGLRDEAKQIKLTAEIDANCYQDKYNKRQYHQHHNDCREGILRLEMDKLL